MKKAFVSEVAVFVALCVGMGSFFVSNMCVKNMQTSFWIGVACAALICAAVMGFIYFTEKRIEKITDLNSKRLCKDLRFVLFVLFFCQSATMCAYFSDIVKTWILTDVNEYFILSALCLVAFITLFKSFYSLHKTVALIGILCIAATITTRSAIILSSDIDRIFPIIEYQRIGVGFWKVVTVISGVFSSSALIVYIYLKKLTPSIFIGAVFLSGAVFILIVFSCIAVLGAEQVANAYDAMVLAMRNTGVLGRGDIWFFMVWTFFMISTFCLFVRSGAEMLQIESGICLKVIYLAVLFVFAAIIKKFDTGKWIVNVLSVGTAGLLYVAVRRFFCLKNVKRKGTDDEK